MKKFSYSIDFYESLKYNNILYHNGFSYLFCPHKAAENGLKPTEKTLIRGGHI